MDEIKQIIEETKLKPYGVVYFVINKITGKYYVGQTTWTAEKRWNRHVLDSVRPSRASNHFSRATRKYGKENFEVRVIFTCYDEKTLNEAEIHFIAFFDATNKKVGYNSTIGGLGGKKSDDVKAKMGEANIGRVPTQHQIEMVREALTGIKRSPEFCKGVSERMKGVSVPQEVRKKISKTLTGRINGPHSDETKRKISESNKGKKMSEQAKANMRKPKSPEHIANMRGTFPKGSVPWNKGTKKEKNAAI